MLREAQATAQPCVMLTLVLAVAARLDTLVSSASAPFMRERILVIRPAFSVFHYDDSSYAASVRHAIYACFYLKRHFKTLVIFSVFSLYVAT